MKIRGILFIFLLLCSCGKQKDITIIVHKFPVEERLISSVVNVPPVILSPGNMFITGNHLVIVSPRKDTIFDLFSYPDLKYRFSAGIKGGGPDDFLMIDRRCPVSTENGFNIFLMDSKKYREVGIDDVNKRLYTIREQACNFDVSDNFINGFMPLNDSLFVYYSGNAKDKEYNLLNTHKKDIVSFSPYPQWAVNVSDENSMFIYMKNSTAKPDGKMFAAFYAYFKRWRIFDSEGNLVRDIAVEIPPLTADFSDKENRYIYYEPLFSTNKYIYVCCRNLKNGEPHKDSTELQVWDWDGKPVAKYTLDKYISCFTVDEQKKVLYGANGDEGNEDKIFIYNLPH